jgi:hypothetical protein
VSAKTVGDGGRFSQGTVWWGFGLVAAQGSPTGILPRDPPRGISPGIPPEITPWITPRRIHPQGSYSGIPPGPLRLPLVDPVWAEVAPPLLPTFSIPEVDIPIVQYDLLRFAFVSMVSGSVPYIPLVIDPGTLDKFISRRSKCNVTTTT